MSDLIKTFKTHRYFILLYGGLFIASSWPLLLFNKTFILGDYWQQHYPWAYEYARCLRLGTLPYWVPGVACGFPLVAEGQVGAYYLPHLFLYLLLPFSSAYKSCILLHVLLGGTGFYAYSRKIGLSKEAAAITAVLFSFSSGYGGCFSNTASLRVLAWLPWSLLCLEHLIGSSDKKRFLCISLMGVMFSQMWTAGAPQMALYAAGYLFFLCLLRNGVKHLSDFLAAGFLSVLLSLPQWTATLELVRLSSRPGETAVFATWGSVPPPAFLALFYPRWGTFFGIAFYLGALPVLLSIISLLSRKSMTEKAHWILALLFYLLALGEFIPFYGFLVEKLSLTMLRNPYKFLFFSGVSLGTAAGFGYDQLSRIAADDRLKRRYTKWLCAISAGALSMLLLGRAFLHFFKEPILNFGYRKAEIALAGKKDPLHNISYYREKVEQVYGWLEKLFAYDRWNLIAIVLLLVSLGVLIKVFREVLPGFWKRTALPAVLALDLLIFGFFMGNSFMRNGEDLPESLPSLLAESIKSRQLAEHSNFLEWTKEPAGEILPVSSNLLYPLRHAGGYSPLLIKRYYELSKDLGISDSSLGRRPYSEEVWKKEIGVVEALGVGQILSSEKISLPDTNLLSVLRQSRIEQGKRLESARYLYVPDRILPFAYAVYDWKVIADEGQRLAYLKGGGFRPFDEVVLESGPSELLRRPELVMTPARILLKKDTEVSVQFDALSDAAVVFRSSFYPRWKAEVDGRLEPVVPANHAFSAVFVKKGQHQVRFFYDKSGPRLWEMVSAAVLVVLLFMNVILYNPRHR